MVGGGGSVAIFSCVPVFLGGFICPSGRISLKR